PRRAPPGLRLWARGRSPPILSQTNLKREDEACPSAVGCTTSDPPSHRQGQRHEHDACGVRSATPTASERPGLRERDALDAELGEALRRAKERGLPCDEPLY